MNQVEKDNCLIMGRFLKNARVKAGVTQREVSEACGHKEGQFVSNIERGMCWPPMNVLLQMSDLYGVSRLKLLNKITECRKRVWSAELGINVQKSSK